MPLTEWQKSEFYKLKKAGLLELYSAMAMNMAIPFWWSKHVEGQKPEVVQNGTLCLVNTGSRHIGITCDHVFQGFLDDKIKYPNVQCQFGNNTFSPESRLIDHSPIPGLDLATFDVPEVFVSASPRNYHHNALKWPPDDVEPGDVLLYGGFPQELRTNDNKVVISPFQYFITRATGDTDQDRIVMEPGFGEIFWPGHEGRADQPEVCRPEWRACLQGD